MKFPYGLSDFYRIIKQDYYYIDRTALIKEIEEAGEQLLFLRPRRFGKSLWLSTLENYYDIGRKEEFEELFGHLAIGQNPTQERNRYFILNWDFSIIDANGDYEHIVHGIHSHINGMIDYFSARYQHWLPTKISLDENNSLRSFSNLISSIKPLGHPLYLLIDEYDNFANEVMTNRHQSKTRNEELVRAEGIIKTVFKAVKAAASGRGLERVFITGVTPLVMSDITSGYNVSENISHLPTLNTLCGFSSEEILTINRKIVHACELPTQSADEAMTMMRRYYNGYRFCLTASEKVYNPTLALYFFKAWQRKCSYPEQMLDSNLSMDKNRLDYIASLPHGNALIEQLSTTLEPVIIDELYTAFGVESLLNPAPDSAYLLSLLTWFGVLTIEGRNELGQLTLTIPNQVVHSLYIEKLQRSILPSVEDTDRRRQLAIQFYTHGDLAPLVAFIESRFLPALSNRDQRWSNELTLKVTLITLLMNSLNYSTRSELGVGRGYTDLLLEVRPDKRQTPLLDHLFELKYLPLKILGQSDAELNTLTHAELAALPAVKAALDQAEQQLANYIPTLQNENPATTWKLRSHALVMIGLNRVAWRTL
jgi:hypothetical protein